VGVRRASVLGWVVAAVVGAAVVVGTVVAMLVVEAIVGVAATIVVEVGLAVVLAGGWVGTLVGVSPQATSPKLRTNINMTENSALFLTAIKLLFLLKIINPEGFMKL